MNSTFLKKIAVSLLLALVGPVSAYELHIAPINDHHSNTRPLPATLTIDGESIGVSLGGFARLATEWNDFEQREPDLLKLHAGDAITGTPDDKFFKGEPDTRAMSVVCFDAFVIGKLAKDESLCLKRVPGSVNRGTSVCENVVERAGDSDVSQVLAEAYRLAPDHGPADIGLANAGGVRVPLETDGPHDLLLTQGAAYTLQPLPNELYVANLSGVQILDTLQEAVSNWKDSGHSDGSHPDASGLQRHLDLNRPKGQRFNQIERKDHATGQWLSLDPQATYSVAMTDSLAQGFDGYRVAGDVCKVASPPQCMTAGGTFFATAMH